MVVRIFMPIVFFNILYQPMSAPPKLTQPELLKQTLFATNNTVFVLLPIRLAIDGGYASSAKVNHSSR